MARSEQLTIRKRPSGGRGEYEMSGSLNGIGATELQGRTLVLETPYGSLPTAAYVSSQGGKPRIRLSNPNDRSQPHIAPILAALLMMPNCTRDESKISRALPVLLESRYVLDIVIGQVEVGLSGNSAAIFPEKLIARSGDIGEPKFQEEFDYLARTSRIDQLQGEIQNLTSELESAIRVLLNAMTRVDENTYIRVRQAFDVLTSTLDRVDPLYIPGSDPLLALERLAGVRALTPESVPSPDDTPPILEIRLRAERQFKETMASRSRGSAGRKFSQDVLSAYDNRCVMCGLKAPGAPGIPSGVDAAHILPWSSYDLDVVSNGLVLCKQHHWAFDARILRLDYTNGQYVIGMGRFYNHLTQDTEASRLLFSGVIGKIPGDRLPDHLSRPSPRFLEEFNALIDEAV